MVAVSKSTGVGPRCLTVAPRSCRGFLPPASPAREQGNSRGRPGRTRPGQRFCVPACLIGGEDLIMDSSQGALPAPDPLPLISGKQPHDALISPIGVTISGLSGEGTAWPQLDLCTWRRRQACTRDHGQRPKCVSLRIRCQTPGGLTTLKPGFPSSWRGRPSPGALCPTRRLEADRRHRLPPPAVFPRDLTGWDRVDLGQLRPTRYR